MEQGLELRRSQRQRARVKNHWTDAATSHRESYKREVVDWRLWKTRFASMLILAPIAAAVS